MGEDVIGKVSIQVGAKSTLQEDLKGAVDGARKALEGLGNAVTGFVSNPLGTMRNALASAAGAIGPVGVGVATLATGAVAAGAGIIHFAESVAEAGKKLEVMSVRTGINTTLLQGLQDAAALAGVSTDGLTSGITALNRQLGMPHGGQFGEAMKLMGIAIMDAGGKMRPVQDILADFERKLDAIADPSERAQTALAALGRHNVDLATAMLATNASFIEQATALGKLHGFTEDQIKRQAELHEKMVVLGIVAHDVKQVFMDLAVRMVDWGLKAVTAIGSVTRWMGELLSKVPGTKSLGEAIKNVGIGIENWKVMAGVQAQAQERVNAEVQKSLGVLRSEQDALKKSKEESDKLQKSMAELAAKYDRVSVSAETVIERMMAQSRTGLYEELAKIDTKLRELDSTMGGFSTTARGLAVDRGGLQDVASLLEVSTSNADKFTAGLINTDKSARDLSTTLRQEVGTVFTNLEQGLAQNILAWKGWADTVKSVLMDFAQAALSLVMEKLLGPLEAALSKAIGAIGGLFGGAAGTATSAAGAAAGTAVSGAGGIAGGAAGTASSLGSSLLTGGIAAVGSIIGGAISGAMVRQDTKEIEVNTRYTWLYLDQINKRHYEMQNIVWHLDDTWGGHLEWIHYHTEMTATRVDEVWSALVNGFAELRDTIKAAATAAPAGAVDVTINLDGRTVAETVIDLVRANRGGIGDALRSSVRP